MTKHQSHARIFPVFGLILSVLAFGLPAQATELDPPDSGFLIELSTSNGIPQTAGGTARIEGRILFTGKKFEDAWKSHGKDDNHGKSVDTLPELLAKRAIFARFFFPDFTSEVAAPVDADGRFHFDTPSLGTDSANSFSALVTRLSPESRALLAIQSKLEKRAVALSELIAKRKSEGAKAELISGLEAKLARIERVSEKITAKLARKGETLAQATLPLLVGNKVPANGVVSTVMGKFLLSVQASPDTAIQGMSSTITATITNLRKPEDDDHEGDDEDGGEVALWLDRLGWNGAQVGELGPQAIPNGGSRTFTFTPSRLQPGDANAFSIEHFAWDAEDGKLGKRFGHVALKIPTALDATPPKWVLATITPDSHHVFAQTFQTVYGLVHDDFGLMDRASLQVLLIGVQVDGTRVERDLTGQLSISSPDEGQMLVVSGDINPVPEGAYVLGIRVRDLALNKAVPYPVERMVQIDRTRPQITLGISGPVYTNGIMFELPVSTLDRSPTMARVVHNGIEIAASQDVSFVASATLAPGVNTFQVTARDAAENEAEAKVLTVIYDTTPPILSHVTPTDGQTVSDFNIPISLTSNEELQYAWVNGRELTLSADRLSASGTYTADIAGSIRLHISARDLASNLATQDMTVTLPSPPYVDRLPASPPADQTGLRLKIHGANLGGVAATLRKVILDVASVEVVNSAGTAYQLGETPVEVDFIALGNDLRAPIGSALVPAGQYQQIRIHPGGSSRVETGAGVTRPLTLGPAAANGIVVFSTMEFRGGRIADTQLQLALDQSIAQLPNGDYVLNPSLQLCSMAAPTPVQQEKIVAALGEQTAAKMVDDATIVIQTKVDKVNEIKLEPTNLGFPFAFTHWEVKVEDQIKGAVPSTYIVRTIGGVIGDQVYAVSGEPARFAPGQQSILLLKQYPDGIDVLGGSAGNIGL